MWNIIVYCLYAWVVWLVMNKKAARLRLSKGYQIDPELIVQLPCEQIYESLNAMVYLFTYSGWTESVSCLSPISQAFKDLRRVMLVSIKLRREAINLREYRNEKD